MAAKPDPKGDDAGAAPKKKGKGLLIGIIVAVLLAGGGGAAWFFTRPAPNGDEEGEVSHSKKKAVESVFMALDPFTVNLADPGGERLIQVAVSLELAGPEVQAQISKYLPVIRNSLLLLISSQESKTLLSLDGKLALADEIAIRTGMALGWRPEEPEPAEKSEGGSSARLAGARRTVHRAAPRPNPVLGVHFAQFLVQ